MTFKEGFMKRTHMFILSISILSLLSFIAYSTYEMRMETEAQLKRVIERKKDLKQDIKILKSDIDEKKQEIIQEEQAQPVWESLGEFRVTYYGKDVGNITANGSIPEVGKTIGVNPTIVPYGSQVMVDGHVYEAQDTGAYTGNFVDILCESSAEAIQLGTHRSEVFILRGE